MTVGFRARTLAVVLVAALVPLAAFGSVIDRQTQQALEDRVLAQLQSFSEQQVRRIEKALSEPRETLALIASRTQMRILLAEIYDAGNESARDLVVQILQDAADSDPTILALHIVAPDGLLVLSTDTASWANTDRPALTTAQLVSPLAGPSFWLAGGELLGSAGTPLTLDSRDLGLLVLDTALRDLRAIVADYVGLGATGETLLARRVGTDAAQFLTPVRFDPEAALNRTVSPDRGEVPVMLGLRGQAGVYTETRDYRGVSVLASVEYLADHDLTIVTKIDRAEAFAPVAAMRSAMLLTGIGALMVAAVIAIAAANSVSRPVRRLADAARAMETDGGVEEFPAMNTPELDDLRDRLNSLRSSLLSANKDLERRVVERTDELEDANRRLDEFAYMAAHDIQAPLRTIRSFLKIIQDRSGKAFDETTQKQFGYVVASAERLQRLTLGMLRYARLTDLDKVERIDLNAVARELVEVMSVDIKGVSATVEVDDLPTVMGDGALLGSVVQNLIANALKYVAPDREPRIRISQTPTAADKVRITVEDNGSGIRRDDIPKIFEMFRRVDVEQNPDGVGIGLATVRRILLLHGATISVDSELGRGSKFHIDFPVADDQADAAVAEE